MSDPKPVPEMLYSIPDDLPDETKLHMRAQMVIQAAFYTFGDPDERPGTMTMGTVELIEVLSAATAMLLAANEGLKTKRDIRLATESHEKVLRGLVEAWREDATSKQMLDQLGIDTSKPH